MFNDLYFSMKYFKTCYVWEKKNLENFAHNFIIAQNTLTLVQVRVYNLNVIVKKIYV